MAAAARRRLDRSAILAPAEYERVRKQRRAEVLEIKRQRRVPLGPFATFYFENFDTLWYQIQEMLRIEKGGEEQIAGELQAYGTLLPQGRELVATVMFEIEDPERRDRELRKMGGVERTVHLEIDGERIAARSDEDIERTDERGKTSSVHFFHFPLTDAQAAKVKTPGSRILLGMAHPAYSHMTVLPETTREALAADLD